MTAGVRSSSTTAAAAAAEGDGHRLANLLRHPAPLHCDRGAGSGHLDKTTTTTISGAAVQQRVILVVVVAGHDGELPEPGEARP